MFYSSRKFNRGSSRFAAIMMASALVTIPAFADTGMGARSLHNGVVVSPENGIVYLMTPEGGIDGIDLASGSVSWRTIEAAKPLTLIGDLLVAQAEPETKGMLPIVKFDTRGAGAAQSTVRIALPNDVRARIDDGLGQSFQIRATANGAQRASLSWNSFSQLPSAISPKVMDPTITPALDVSSVTVQKSRFQTSVRHSGALQLDLVSDRAEEVAMNKGQSIERPSLRELAASKRLADVPGRQFLSIDGRHMLVSLRQADGGVEGRYQWTVFNRSSGEQVGQVPNRAAAAPFLVSGTSLVYASSPVSHRREGQWVDEPLALRSIDLVSGVERWSHKIRDTRYAGPFPQ